MRPRKKPRIAEAKKTSRAERTRKDILLLNNPRRFTLSNILYSSQEFKNTNAISNLLRCLGKRRSPFSIRTEQGAGQWTPEPKVGGSNPLRHAIRTPLLPKKPTT